MQFLRCPRCIHFSNTNSSFNEKLTVDFLFDHSVLRNFGNHDCLSYEGYFKHCKWDIEKHFTPKI